MRRFVLWGLVFLMLLAVGACKERGSAPSGSEASEVEKPPAPNFDTPVDYVEWYRKRTYPKEWPAGEQVYAGLLAAAQGNAIPAPDKKLKNHLASVALGRPSANNISAVRDYLGLVESHLNMLEAGSQERRVQWFTEFDQALLTWEDPLAKASRSLGTTLLARARLMAEPDGGTAAPLLKAWETGLRHADHLHARGSTSGLTSLIYRSYVYKSIRKALEQGLLKESDLSMALHILQEYDAENGMGDLVLFEWISLLDLLQRLFPQGRFSPAAAKKLGQDQYISGPFLPSPAKTAQRIERYFLPMMEGCSDTWSRDMLRKLDKLENRKQRIAKGNIILSLYLPSSLSLICKLGLCLESERRATILAVAMHLYHHQHGRWPAVPGDCELENIEKVQIDPVAEKPYGYKIIDGRPVLFSLGFDGIDNGGKHDRSWPDDAEGSDYVFFPIPD